jgi:hypothetical protein
VSNVRPAKGQENDERPDKTPMWSTGLARLATGGILGMPASSPATAARWSTLPVNRRWEAFG